MNRQLSVAAATAENVAPFGSLLAPDPARHARTSAFYGNAVELWSQDGFHSDADTCLSVARVHPRVNEVVWMERHFKHTQAFVPLGGKPFIVVLGTPSAGSAPDPATVRALRFDGAAGLMMHIGTWHEFPFAVAGATDLLVVLRNETNRNLEVRANDEALGGDLEKRNLRTRLGFSFTF